MPNRIVRGDMLDSERYWSVTLEARQLFWHLLLLADDFGCVSLAPVLIRRRCFDDTPTQARIEKLLSQLQDEDLLRIYDVGNGRYGFIPRFRQKLRIMKPKFPAPPEALYSDDLDAKEKFNAIKVEHIKLSDGCNTAGSHTSPEEKGKEKEKESERGFAEAKPKDGTPILQNKSVKEWAAELGIERQPGEGEAKFQIRIMAAVAKHKKENLNAVPN